MENKNTVDNTINCRFLESDKLKPYNVILLAGDDKLKRLEAFNQIYLKQKKHNELVIILSGSDGGNDCVSIEDLVEFKYGNDENLMFTFKNQLKNRNVIVMIYELKTLNNSFENLLRNFQNQNPEGKKYQLWISVTNSVASEIKRILPVHICFTLEVPFICITEEHNLTDKADKIKTTYESILKNVTPEQLGKLKFFALSEFLDKEIVFGVQSVVPESMTILQVNASGHIVFENNDWYFFLIAQFIYSCFFEPKYISDDSQMQFINFFLDILKNKNYKCIREILNCFDFTKASANLSDTANCLKKAICESSYGDICTDQSLNRDISEDGQSYFNLMNFVLLLLGRIEWNEKDRLSEFILNILKSNIPIGITKKDLETVENVKKLVNCALSIPNHELCLINNKSLAHVLASKSNDETLINWLDKSYLEKVLNDNIILYEIVIETGNENLLSMLLELTQVKVLETVADMICRSEKFYLIDCLEKFCKKNRKFEKICQIIEGNKGLISKFRQDIENGNVEDVLNFVIKNSAYKNCKLNSEKTAVHLALETGNHEIFEILQDNDFAKPDTPIPQQLKNKVLENNMLKLEKPHENDFRLIELLIAKFLVPKGSTEIPIKLYSIFLRLFNNPFIAVLLRFVAFLNITIIYIGDNKLHKIDYNADKYTNGLFSPSCRAILLPSCEDEAKWGGILVHELMHCALYYLYDNNCLPYFEYDLKRKEQFQKYTNELRLRKIDNLILSSVFTEYPKSLWEQELAVRAMQLEAEYYLKDDDQTLTYLKVYYHEFFSYQRIVSKHFEKGVEFFRFQNINFIPSLPQTPIFEKNDVIIDILNKGTSVTLITKSPELLISYIRQLINMYWEDSSSIESRLSTSTLTLRFEQLCQPDLFRRIRTISASLQRVLVVCDPNKLTKITKEEKNKVVTILKNLEGSKQVVLINPSKDLDWQKPSSTFHFSWNHNLTSLSNEKTIVITEESQRALLNSTLNFQSIECKLENMFCEQTRNEKLLNLLSKTDLTLKINELQASSYDSLNRKVSSEKVKNKPLKILTEVKGKKVVLLFGKITSGLTASLEQVRNISAKNITFWGCSISARAFRNYFKIEKKGVPYELANVIQGTTQAEFFEIFWENGNIKLFVDDIDKVEPNVRANVINLIQDNSINMAFLTSRLHMEATLKNELPAYEIFTLNEIDPLEKNKIISSNFPGLSMWNDPFKDHLEHYPDISLFELIKIYKKLNNPKNLQFKIYEHFNKNVRMNYFSEKKCVMSDDEVNSYNMNHFRCIRQFPSSIEKAFGSIKENSRKFEQYPLINSVEKSIISDINNKVWVGLFYKYLKNEQSPECEKVLKELESEMRSQEDCKELREYLGIAEMDPKAP